MASRLKNILAFSVAGGGGSQTVSHGLNINGLAVKPDVISTSGSGSDLVITASITSVTVVNNGADLVAFDALVEAWHTFERAFGTSGAGMGALTPQPFVVTSGGGGGGSGAGFVPQGGPEVPGVGEAYTSAVVAWVNSHAADAADDGNTTTPFLTIQGAIDAIPEPGSIDNQSVKYVVMVAPGSYIEDLVLPNFGVRLQMIAMGSVAVSSITWEPGGGGAEFGETFVSFSAWNRGFPRDQLFVFGTYVNDGWLVSGNFLVEGPVIPAAQTITFSIQDMRVTGTLDIIDGGGGADVLPQINFFMRQSVVFGVATITASQLFFAYGQELYFPSGLTSVQFSVMDDITASTLTVTSGSNGRWTNSRIGQLITNAGATGPFMDQPTWQYIVDQGAALPSRGPRPLNALRTLARFGALDIEAAANTRYLPQGMGAVSATDVFGVGVAGNQRQALAGMVARVNIGAGNGTDFTVEVLINGAAVAAATLTLDSATVNQVDVTLDPMVLIPADAVLSCRVVKAGAIGSGVLNVTVDVLAY